MTGDTAPGDMADGATGPYRIVDTRARVKAGIVYLAMAAVCAAIAVGAAVPWLIATGVAPLVVIGGWQIACAWRMPVTGTEAIAIAGRSTSFPVGHGSATLGYRGIAARPVWQVLVFSATPSPDHQALVTVDAVNGDATGIYEEAVELP